MYPIQRFSTLRNSSRYQCEKQTLTKDVRFCDFNFKLSSHLINQNFLIILPDKMTVALKFPLIRTVKFILSFL